MTASSPTGEATSPSPIESPATWEARYTQAELAAYRSALAVWTEYDAESEPFWAAGQATPAAQQMFQKYFPSPIWMTYFQRLQTYQQAGVTVTGQPTVYWSKATRIKTQAHAGSSVSIVECVDYATQAVSQGGKDVPAIARPAIRSAVLDDSGDSHWVLLRIVEPSLRAFTSCDKAAS